MNCPYCHSPVPPNVAQCLVCGAQVPVQQNFGQQPYGGTAGYGCRPPTADAAKGLRIASFILFGLGLLLFPLQFFGMYFVYRFDYLFFSCGIFVLLLSISCQRDKKPF